MKASLYKCQSIKNSFNGNSISCWFKNVFIRSFHLYNCKIIEKTPNTTCCLMRPWAHAPLQAVLIVSVIRYFSFYIHSTVDLLVHEPVHRAHIPRYHRSRNTNISSYYTTCHLAHILGFNETSWKALYEITRRYTSTMSNAAFNPS